MPEFDATSLLATLRVELRAAWATIQSGHAQERLYGFGVYTTDEASYLMVTGFSEAGLDSTVERYKHGKYGKGKDPELLRQSLRWSPCDSPLHDVGEDLLLKSNELVQALDPAARGEDDDDEGADFDDDDDDFDEDDDSLDPEVLAVFDVAVQALQEMDQEGLFGHGAERERLVLCLWKGDQSNVERHEFAKALNPAAVAKRFGEQMNAGTRAFYQANFPDHELPEDDVFD